MSAALGNYLIQVRTPDEAFMAGNFEVEEYKKPEYEVRVTLAKPRVLEGEPGEATIDARYFFGEPVSGAKVKYAVYRSPYYFPLWYDPDDDGGGRRPARRRRGRRHRFRRRADPRPGRRARCRR